MAAGADRAAARKHVLVVAQIAISFLILVAAGLFVRDTQQAALRPTGIRLAKNILLFLAECRARPGIAKPEIAIFYAEPAQALRIDPGVSSATLSQSSIITPASPGRQIKGANERSALFTVDGARVLAAGPRFLTTMQIPILAGREIDDRDQPGSRPVAVISERLARNLLRERESGGRAHHAPDEKRDLEIVGVFG